MKRGVIIGAAALVVAAAAGTSIYWNLPDTRAGRALERASEYLTEMNYVEAQEAFEEVLEIDETSVKAYRGLADDYMAQGMQEQAEQILRQGYEVTGSEVLLQNYFATVLNDVVAQINDGSAGWQTIGRCLDVLEEKPDEQDALKLLETCAQRLLERDEEGSARVMLDGLDGSGSFTQYAAVLDRLFALASVDAAAYVPVIREYLTLDAPVIYLSLSHRDAYEEMLTKAQALGIAEVEGLLACLDKQAQVSGYFAPMFEEFEAENFKAAKEFITGEEFVAIRDAFIDGTMECWKVSSYVPVTKEAIAFEAGEEGWEFSFVEDDGIAYPSGTIRLLAQKMTDLGVQRSVIEYVPAYDPAAYYPHTEYEIVYWNTKVSGIATDATNAVARMNYRFAQKTYTQTGMQANMIYDWGGPNESRKTE